MQSRKPIAKEFKKEVKKILKEIRLTGEYRQETLKQQALLVKKNMVVDIPKNKEYQEMLKSVDEKCIAIQALRKQVDRYLQADVSEGIRKAMEMISVELMADVVKMARTQPNLIDAPR